MTAATVTGTRASTTLPTGGSGPTFGVQAAWGTVTVDDATEDGDIFEVCWLPAGATVIGGWIMAIDGDTGIEALDIDLGIAANGVDSADPDMFGNNGVWIGGKTCATGNWIPLTGVLQTVGPKTFTVPTKVQLETNVAAATGVAMEVTVVLLYLFNAP